MFFPTPSNEGDFFCFNEETNLTTSGFHSPQCQNIGQSPHQMKVFVLVL